MVSARRVLLRAMLLRVLLRMLLSKHRIGKQWTTKKERDEVQNSFHGFSLADRKSVRRYSVQMEIAHLRGSDAALAAVHVLLENVIRFGKACLETQQFPADSIATEPRVSSEFAAVAPCGKSNLAVIEQRQTADNGEIVVAMIDEAVTLKRFFRENNRVKLVAENPAYAPIYTQDVRILGRLRGIIRKY